MCGIITRYCAAVINAGVRGRQTPRPRYTRDKTMTDNDDTSGGRTDGRTGGSEKTDTDIIITRKLPTDRETDKEADERQGILSRDAGERFVGGLGRQVHETNHLSELCTVSLVDRVSNVRQLTADLRRRTTHAPHNNH